MIEIDLAHLTVNLNDLLPVVRMNRAVVMLDKFELVRESSSQNKVIFTILVVTANLLDNKALKVFIYGDASHQTVYLRAFRVEVNLAFLVEHSLLSIWTQIEEFIFVNEEFWGPGRWHIKDIFLLLLSIVSIFIGLFFLVCTVIFAFAVIFLLFLLLQHNVLPFTGLIILEFKVDLMKSTSGVKIDPVVTMVEYRLDRVVWGIIDGILAARRGLNEEGLLDLSISLLQ